MANISIKWQNMTIHERGTYEDKVDIFANEERLINSINRLTHIKNELGKTQIPLFIGNTPKKS